MAHTVDFSFALFLPLLLDSVLAAQLHPGMRPNALLRGTEHDSRGSVQRQHQPRLPLYMMQLYRTMLTEDRHRTAAASVSHTGEDSNPALHDSDSVISLVAKSEYSEPGESNCFCFTIKPVHCLFRMI